MIKKIEHVYIHIPFCVRKCRYCSFVSGFDINWKYEYLNALKREILSEYNGDKLKTVYIGGGTPSLLNGKDVAELLSMFDISEVEEITLEANPETVTRENFEQYRKAGVNRISLGVQTFDEEILKLIGRNHAEKDITDAVSVIKNSGFDNISIDLIYGLPLQNLDKLYIDINKILKLHIQHISTYGLKIEPGSYFDNHPVDNLPDDENQAQMYKYICELLKNNGYEHYEISNFSLPGCNSRHNVAYWKNKEYYGFGLNASGYQGNRRYTNIADIKQYVVNPSLKSFEENLTPEQILEEEIILALRLKAGINIEEINKKFKIDFSKKYKKIIEKYINFGLLSFADNNIHLTEAGFLLSNEIMSDFIL